MLHFTTFRSVSLYICEMPQKLVMFIIDFRPQVKDFMNITFIYRSCISESIIAKQMWFDRFIAIDYIGLIKTNYEDHSFDRFGS